MKVRSMPILLLGAFFVVLGITFLLEALFGIHIPLMRIFFALFFIYIGYAVITGDSYKNFTWEQYFRTATSGQGYQFTHRRRGVVAGTGHIIVDANYIADADTSELEYSTVMGNLTIDFSRLELAALQRGETLHIYVKTVLGNTTVRLNKDIPVRIYGHSSFGKISMPNDTDTTFGSDVYLSHAATVKPLCIIHCKNVLGSTTFVY